MKNNFIRWWNILIQLLICFALLEVAYIAVIIVCVAKYNFEIAIIFAIVLLVFIFIELLTLVKLSNRLLSKVQINETGIVCVSSRRQIDKFSWDEIIDIKKTYIMQTQSIFIELKDRRFDLNVSKKIMRTLIYYCTNDEISKKMNEIKLAF